jgi:3-hydroxyisobutyrate dehydrogenase-like beta-hydroxyacid dehydrogenase
MISMAADNAPIGFIGLGQMGLPMAKHLLASGKNVHAWSRSAEERDVFNKAGGTVVERLAEIGQCATVFSIVFDDDAVRDIVLGRDGLASTLKQGATHVAMETISPALARDVSDAYGARGVHHLSSPVFGPPHVAAAAELKFNCSGPLVVYQAVEPLLATMGTSYWFGQEPEQALMVKLMGNNMIFTIIELMHEAFEFLGAGGIKESDVKEMLIERLFQSPIITGYAQFFVANPGAKPPFDANPIPRKDNKLCLEMAEKMGIDLSLVSLVREKMLSAG